MDFRSMNLLLTIEKRLSVLDSEHEHRTGLGLARAHPSALAGLVPAGSGLTHALGKWADILAAQVVTATETLLPGFFGMPKPRARTEPADGSRPKAP